MMKQDDKDVDWHIIYEGSGSITGNSWIEEVAYLGDEQWLLKLYDDPAWSFEPEEPMQPEEKNSEELVDWVKSIDSASNKDSFARPRQKSLYEVAKNLGATRCVKLLSSIRMSIPEENTDINKTGKVIRKGKKFSITEALPTDPIYSRGYVIGGHYSRRSILKKRDKDANAENLEEIEGKKPDKNDASPNQEEE
jgi:hypothetical protein